MFHVQGSIAGVFKTPVAEYLSAPLVAAALAPPAAPAAAATAHTQLKTPAEVDEHLRADRAYVFGAASVLKMFLRADPVVEQMHEKIVSLVKAGDMEEAAKYKLVFDQTQAGILALNLGCGIYDMIAN